MIDLALRRLIASKQKGKMIARIAELTDFLSQLGAPSSIRRCTLADFLVDNSVWARLILNGPVVVERLSRIENSPADVLVTCPPQILEFCHSARSTEDYVRYWDRISLGFPLEVAPEEELVHDIQRDLWNNGYVRAAGPADILIAG